MPTSRLPTAESKRSGLSHAAEDYLKEIFHLAESGSSVGTAELASRLGVAAPSVTSMVKRLHEMGLVTHSPYREIELTATGRVLAVEIVRHHRLIELYLTEFLDVPWDQVHEEAERLEHVISEDLENRMAAKLGDPGFDPHGDPIPSDEGAFPECASDSLWEANPGQRVVVARIANQAPATLAYLSDMGLRPGCEVEVVEVCPPAGTETIRLAGETRIIGADLARSIRFWSARPAGNQERKTNSSP